MKKFFVLFYILVLIVPNNSLAQTEADTCPPVFYNVRDSLARYYHPDAHDGKGYDNVFKPVLEAQDTIELCIYFNTLTEESYDKFCNFLDDETAILIWTTFYEETDDPMVSILIRKDVFERTFNAKVTYKRTAASSHDGFIWQLYLESYIVPEQFKNIINYITTTDPQTCGC
jgi:hypothetical protein